MRAGPGSAQFMDRTWHMADVLCTSGACGPREEPGQSWGHMAVPPPSPGWVNRRGSEQPMLSLLFVVHTWLRGVGLLVPVWGSAA